MSDNAALIVCGLGVRPQLEVTLETLAALKRARAAFCDAEPADMEWLKRRVPGLRRPKDAESVAREAARGGAALAVWGHPQLCSPLAAEALSRARGRGLRCEVLGAISPVGSVFARTASFLGGDYGYQGLQAYGLEAVLEDPGLMDGGIPLVVFARGASGADWARLAALLAGRYPAAHPVTVDDLSLPEPRTAPLEELAAGQLRGAILLVPPLPGARKTRR